MDNGQLTMDNYQLFFKMDNGQLTMDNYQLFIINYQLSAIAYNKLNSSLNEQ